MKTIDLSAKKAGEKSGRAANELLSKIGQSFSNPESRAQENAIQRLGRVLDDRYTLLRKLLPTAAGAPEVFLIIGPGGLWVIHASALRGLFRAVGDQWEVMDSSGKNYRPARPNLIEQVLTARQALAARIDSLGVGLAAPEVAIFLMDAGAHIDLQRPTVRIVQIDALERFAAGLLRPDAYIDPDKLRRVVDGLVHPPAPTGPDDLAGFADLEGRNLPPAAPGQPSRLAQLSSQEPQFVQRIAKRTAFTRRQWIWLGVLLAVNIIVLIIVILVAMVYVYQ